MRENAATGRLRDWLESYLAGAKNGDAVPTEAELVRRFGLSRGTVGRVLREYRDTGRLCRVIGKGTFVGPSPPGGEAAPSPPVSSVESVYRALVADLSDGTIRRGEALPSIKCMCLSLDVAHATVRRAYSRLAAEGRIAKMGKTFRVAAAASCRRPIRSGESSCIRRPDFGKITD